MTDYFRHSARPVLRPSLLSTIKAIDFDLLFVIVIIVSNNVWILISRIRARGVHCKSVRTFRDCPKLRDMSNDSG